MADEEAFKDALNGLLLVVEEAGGGFELEAEIFVGVASVVVEEERVGADGEGYGELLEDVKGRRGVVGFIAPDLGADIRHISRCSATQTSAPLRSRRTSPSPSCTPSLTPAAARA
jgi:hypothetical protein